MLLGAWRGHFLRWRVASQVAGRLWQLISEQANLSTHLNALRDYFLLGRGDFLQAFLIEVPFRPVPQLCPVTPSWKANLPITQAS